MMGWTVATARTLTALTLVIAPLALAGCKKAPGGQVVAVVNDEEVTQRELRAEMAGANQQMGADKTATKAVLDRVIDRNLLADYARDQGLDRDAEYVTRRRQLEQALLATMAMRKIAAPAGDPTRAEVQAFITANPMMFGQRQQLTLDQIRLASPDPVSKLRKYTQAGTIDAAARALTADGIPFTRSRQELDTGSISNALAAQIAALPPGEIFDISTDGNSFISVVLARTPSARPEAGWMQPATEAVRQQKANTLMTAAVARLRKGAKITYDAAYSGAASGGAPAAAKR